MSRTGRLLIAIEAQPLPKAPAITIVDARGFIVVQDSTAQQLAGEGVGSRCRDVMGTIPGSEGFACRPGCVSQLLEGGEGHVASRIVRLPAGTHRLTCVSMGDRALCVLSDCLRVRREPWQRLTTRENEVLVLLSEGHTTAEIARALDMSSSTVRTHVEHMRERFGVTTRAALITHCFRVGLID